MKYLLSLLVFPVMIHAFPECVPCTVTDSLHSTNTKPIFGDLTIGASKFTVLAASGNTFSAGTDSVGGHAGFAGTTTFRGAATFLSSISATGNISSTANITASGDVNGTNTYGSSSIGLSSGLFLASSGGNVTMVTDTTSGHTGLGGTLLVRGATHLIGSTQIDGLLYTSVAANRGVFTDVDGSYIGVQILGAGTKTALFKAETGSSDTVVMKRDANLVGSPTVNGSAILTTSTVDSKLCPTWTAGTYAKYSCVTEVASAGVYTSKIDGNTDDPVSSGNWDFFDGGGTYTGSTAKLISALLKNFDTQAP